MLTLQSAFRKRLRKVKPGKYPFKPEHATSKYPRSGSITISPNPKPKTKPLVYGGSLGEQERESSMYRAASRPRGRKPIPGPSRKITGHKDKQGSTAHHAGSVGGNFRPSPADPKRGELPKRPSAEERYAGRAPGDTSKPPRGWDKSRFNPKNKVRGGGDFKQVPADNPYAGGHKNLQAAVMKALKAVRKQGTPPWSKSPRRQGVEFGRPEGMGTSLKKHKDKRGSTAHHRRGGGGGGGGRRQLSVPETHQLRIARQNAELHPAMQGVMGGPDIEESKKIIQELTGRPYKQPKVSPWTGKPYDKEDV